MMSTCFFCGTPDDGTKPGWAFRWVETEYQTTAPKTYYRLRDKKLVCGSCSNLTNPRTKRVEQTTKARTRILVSRIVSG